MNFANTFVQLDERFYQPAEPTPVRAPELFLWNGPLAEALGIAENLADDSAYLAEVFSGNRLPSGSEPIALAYAGHQFGHFVPQLGDGRAHLLGEVLDRSGSRQDIQLKGSGPTRFSRGGDGRCALGPAVREFIMSEALHALRVPTARCLAVVTTGETVVREMPQPGAVVTRVASSHLRVGTLQYFASREQNEALQALCDYAIDRHYPDIDTDCPEGYLEFLDRALGRQIALVVEWMRIGFIHGVMNTDNTALSGQTIDYGPCAMMNSYDPATVFSSIDTHGRYAFGNQPRIAQWNMARLAECLIPLVDENPDSAVTRLNPILESFGERFRHAWVDMMRGKLGLIASHRDEPLIQALLQQMQEHQLDYTLTFQALAEGLRSGPDAVDQRLSGWFEDWRQRVADQAGGVQSAVDRMGRHNPVVIPRNHHVEAVLAECLKSGDGAAAEQFLQVLRTPYTVGPRTADYQHPPPDGDRGYRTFCGT